MPDKSILDFNNVHSKIYFLTFIYKSKQLFYFSSLREINDYPLIHRYNPSYYTMKDKLVMPDITCSKIQSDNWCTFGLQLTLFLFWIFLYFWCVYDKKKLQLLYCLFANINESTVFTVSIKFSNKSGLETLRFGSFLLNSEADASCWTRIANVNFT